MNPFMPVDKQDADKIAPEEDADESLERFFDRLDQEDDDDDED